MISFFEIDEVLINYAYMMTYCHWHVKQAQNTLQTVTGGIFVSRRSKIISFFEIDQVLINYACMMALSLACRTRSQYSKNCCRGYFWVDKVKNDIIF